MLIVHLDVSSELVTVCMPDDAGHADHAMEVVEDGEWLEDVAQDGPGGRSIRAVLYSLGGWILQYERVDDPQRQFRAAEELQTLAAMFVTTLALGHADLAESVAVDEDRLDEAEKDGDETIPDNEAVSLVNTTEDAEQLEDEQRQEGDEHQALVDVVMIALLIFTS